jgi:hypothetical protein
MTGAAAARVTAAIGLVAAIRWTDISAVDILDPSRRTTSQDKAIAGMRSRTMVRPARDRDCLRTK